MDNEQAKKMAGSIVFGDEAHGKAYEKKWGSFCMEQLRRQMLSSRRGAYSTAPSRRCTVINVD